MCIVRSLAAAALWAHAEKFTMLNGGCRCGPERTVMVGCEQGYLCDVCGADVEAITDSDLYLRYVMGEVSPLALPSQRERHIRCNPATAQYIVDPAFAPMRCEGPFSKEGLDADY